MLKFRLSPMFSFDFIKIFLFLAIVSSFFSSCRITQKPEGDTPVPTPFVAGELKSEIPFATKEPEVFQTEIVISTDGLEERKNFVARNGANRRFDFNFGAKNQVSVLQIDKNYLILSDQKIYAENPNGEKDFGSENQTDFLTSKWLYEKTEADFERLETDGNLTKYRVRLETGDLSESIIFVDETLGFPVRQEFYSISGAQKILRFTVELRNLKLQANDDLFLIPKNFRRVTTAEFRKILRNIQE